VVNPPVALGLTGAPDLLSRRSRKFTVVEARKVALIFQELLEASVDPRRARRRMRRVLVQHVAGDRMEIRKPVRSEVTP
jgi:hypothetical protein